MTSSAFYDVIKTILTGVFLADITAFKNFAYSNQGGNQVNIEYGAVIFKGLTMTIIPHSKSAILNMPLHSQSDIQILNFPLS